jgi:hypothetical protein
MIKLICLLKTNDVKIVKCIKNIYLDEKKWNSFFIMYYQYHSLKTKLLEFLSFLKDYRMTRIILCNFWI